MTQEIRWRVLIADPRVQNFVANGRDGSELTGKAIASEIVETLKANLDLESFEPERTLEWLEAQEPADAGDSATLKLNKDLELEIVVRAV
ncbi:MAG TPA: hypothetical protein VFY04_02680 [Solirubrobacterales bacterium]|nr:hypothetical protein [Solirubrobacterales bacterium]